MGKKHGKRVWSTKYQKRYDAIPDHIKLIVEAIKKEDIASIKMILKYDHDFNLPYVDGSTPFFHAVASKKLDIVQLFLDIEDIDLDKPDVFGCTPLHQAVLYSELDIVKLLVQYGAVINTLDKYNATPLDDAARVGDLELVRFLLDNKADPFQTSVEADEVNDHNSLELIHYHRKKIASLEAVRAAACLSVFLKPQHNNKSKSNKIHILPFELRMLTASFIIGSLPEPVAKQAKLLTEVPAKDNITAMFLYSSKVRNYKLHNMYIFSFLMHNHLNIIDSNFAKLNLMLALKLLGCRNTTDSENKELEYYDSNNYGNFLQKHVIAN